MQSEGNVMMDEKNTEKRLNKRTEGRKKNLPYTGCGILVSILFLVVLTLTGRMGVRTTLEITSVEKYTLLDIDQIEQEIKVNYNYLESLSMLVVNVEEGQEGILQLELLNERGKKDFSREFSLNKIKIGEFQKFPVHKLLKSGNYILRISYYGNVPEYGVPKVMALEKSRNLDVTGTCYNLGEVQWESLALGYDYYQIPYGLWIAIAAVIPLFFFLIWDMD